MKKLKKLMLLSLLLLGVTGCGLWNKENENMQLDQNNNQIEQTEEKDKENIVESAHDNKLVIAMNTTTTLNPLYNTQANVEQALYLIFSPLINIEEDGSVTGNLAESWVVNENQTAVTVTLKSGLVWHDGKPVTSEDVLFTLTQINVIEDSPYKQAVENIQSMEKIDDTTFKIIYKQSFSGLLQTLFFPVIPKHVYNVENNQAMSITPVGCGPYIYESITPLKAVYLKANPTYFKGKPHIETIQINLIPDEVSGLYSFKQGLIDMVYTSETEWGKYTNRASREPYEMVSPIYEFMGVNFNKPMFQSADIRNALVYALNREEIVKLYYLEHAIITDTPISPVSYLYDKNLETKQYDKEKARYLLAEQGYELDETTGYMTKEGKVFSFTLMVNNENTDRIKVAKAIQRMYADVGIDMKIEQVDKETYLSRLASEQFEAFLGAWQLSYVLDLSFAFHSSSIADGENYVSYKDEKMDELLQQAFLATGTNVYEAYDDLQEYFVEKTPYISLYFKKSVLMMKDTIGGNIKATPCNIFSNIEDWMIS